MSEKDPDDYTLAKLPEVAATIKKIHENDGTEIPGDSEEGQRLLANREMMRAWPPSDPRPTEELEADYLLQHIEIALATGDADGRREIVRQLSELIRRSRQYAEPELLSPKDRVHILASMLAHSSETLAERAMKRDAVNRIKAKMRGEKKEKPFAAAGQVLKHFNDDYHTSYDRRTLVNWYKESRKKR